MSKLTVSLVTPTADLLRGEVLHVTAPSAKGEVGILPGHLPLLATLVDGAVGLYSAAGAEFYAVSGGILEVDHDAVTLLADTAERARDIDIRRSERSLQAAQNCLAHLDFTDPQYARYERRARRARTRIRVAGLMS